MQSRSLFTKFTMLFGRALTLSDQQLVAALHGPVGYAPTTPSFDRRQVALSRWTEYS